MAVSREETQKKMALLSAGTLQHTRLAKLGVTTALINSNVQVRVLEHALEVVDARARVLGSECPGAFASVSDAIAGRIPVHVSPDPDGDDAPTLPAGARDRTPALAAASLERQRLPAFEPEPGAR